MSRSSVPRALRLLGLCIAAHACAPAPRDAPLRLGFWNVRRLGLEPGKDVALLCDLARRHFDVLGLVEVMADDATGDGASLRRCLAQDFLLRETPEAAPRGSPYGEEVWLAVRPSAARPCGDAARGLVRVGSVDEFTRPPAFACLELASGAELALGVFHARWGGGAPTEAAREVVALPNAMRAAGAELLATPPRSVLLLGDLNLTPELVSAHTGLAVRTRGSGSTLGPTGEPTLNLYDQLLVLPGSPIAPVARVLDLRAAAGGADVFRRTLSDHLPIVAELAAKGAEHGQAPSPVPYTRPSGVTP